LWRDIFLATDTDANLPNTEFEGRRIDPLIVSVFYTESVFIAENEEIYMCVHFVEEGYIYITYPCQVHISVL
jgi:hypothetical protein